MGRDRLAIVAGIMCLIALGAVAVRADDKPNAPDSALPARTETRHTLNIAGRALDYRAVAETIGLTDRKGDATAAIYTVSYLADAAAGTTRPAAFVFNGGPRAASGVLHLGAFGPPILDPPARR